MAVVRSTVDSHARRVVGIIVISRILLFPRSRMIDAVAGAGIVAAGGR